MMMGHDKRGTKDDLLKLKKMESAKDRYVTNRISTENVEMEFELTLRFPYVTDKLDFYQKYFF